MRKGVVLFLCLIGGLFINRCDDNGVASDSTAPAPVVVVSMGLSGVEDDFATNTDLQDDLMKYAS